MHVKNKHGLSIGDYNKKHMQVLNPKIQFGEISILAAQCRVQRHKYDFWQGEKDWNTEGEEIFCRP